MPTGRVIEVVGGRNLVLRTVKKERSYQQFFFDATTKTIKSQAYKNKSIDIQNGGRSTNLQIWTTNARWFQLFRFKNGYLVNERGQVIEVQGNQDRENANIAMGGKKDALNQQWEIVFADELVIEYKKGELNPDFGFYVEREFSIATKMSSGRYMDVIDNGIVIKRRNGYKTQKWYFDQKSKTIKSVAYDSKSWSINSSGQNRNMNLYKTTGEWF